MHSHQNGEKSWLCTWKYDLFVQQSYSSTFDIIKCDLCKYLCNDQLRQIETEIQSHISDWLLITCPNIWWYGCRLLCIKNIGFSQREVPRIIGKQLWTHPVYINRKSSCSSFMQQSHLHVKACPVKIQCVPEKRKPINQVNFSENWIMIYQKKFTLLQNSVYPLLLTPVMYWPCMAKHEPFQMVMSKLICAE